MNIDYELLFPCIALAGLGIFAGIHNLIKQQPPRHFSKAMIASLGLIIGDVSFFIMMCSDNKNTGLSILITCLGIPLILWGLHDASLVKKCSYQVNAVCVYCTPGKKGGVNPVFTYTYEGETYKANSQQSLSSGILVADKTYRIYIDPKKPTRNIIFPRLMKNNKDFIIGGAVMIIAGIGLLVATQLNLVSLF